MYYGKKQFASDRKVYLQRRREALSENDEKNYKQLVIQMQQEEDMLFQERLQEICDRLGLSQQEFMRTSMMYQQDQMKAMRIMNLQQQIQVGELPDKSREEVLDMFQIQQRIQIESMDSMLESMPRGQNPSEEG
jgi:hypothetical protein